MVYRDFKKHHAWFEAGEENECIILVGEDGAGLRYEPKQTLLDYYYEDWDYGWEEYEKKYDDAYMRWHGIIPDSPREYSASNPWDAPGMKVSDFI